MKKLVYLASLTLFAIAAAGTSAHAQQGLNITLDQGSINLFGKNYVGAKGSAFLYNDWAQGSVKLNNGIEYEGMALLYDQIKDELIFNSPEGKRQIFMYPVQEFKIQAALDDFTNKRVFRNGFPVVEGAAPSTFYEVLYDGETKLLKRISKAIVEERPDGSIVKEKQIKETVRYYVATADKLIKINKNKKSVLEALQDKAPALEKYMKAEKIDVKDEADLQALLAYYDTL